VIRVYFSILLTIVSLFADTYVDGYTRSDGTYNYSTDGNINPYTGEEGTREVYDDYNYNNSYTADDEVAREVYDESEYNNNEGYPLLATSSPQTVDNNNYGWIVVYIIGGFLLLLLKRYIFKLITVAIAIALFWFNPMISIALLIALGVYIYYSRKDTLLGYDINNKPNSKIKCGAK